MQGLEDGHEPPSLSCRRASNSNHPDPSVNPNLLTLTAADKRGLTNLNLAEALPSLPPFLESLWPSLQVAPHLAIPKKCQHPLPP